MMEQIELHEHNPQWFSRFAEEKEALQKSFGERISGIFHVGSTAVAGLIAKPIIDIAMECDIYPPDSQIQQQFQSLGYEAHGEAGVTGRYWFTKGHPRLINLHFCKTGSPIVKKQLLFRDALVENALLRSEYASLKLRNSVNNDIDDAGYAKSKSSLIEKTLSTKGVSS